MKSSHLSSFSCVASLSMQVSPSYQTLVPLSSMKKKLFTSTDSVCFSVQDECYQVRQIFAQKLHLALVKLLLPLEYLAVFALCAKDPVKERRAHARQCLLKNISVRREYIKQNPLAQGQFSPSGRFYAKTSVFAVIMLLLSFQRPLMCSF